MNASEVGRDESRGYEYVGWLSVPSAALLFPAVVLSFILEIGRRRAVLALLAPYAVLFGLSTGLSLCVLYRFKRKLNQRHGFHDADGRRARSFSESSSVVPPAGS